MTIRALPTAEAELAAAARWYEERDRGLGVDLIAEVDRVFEHIVALPAAYPFWRADRDYRKARLKRFPYVIFYRVLDDHVLVVAIAHTKRRPGYWIDRDP